MRLSVFIARRYLFSPKKQHAINIISMISVVGVAVGTSALIVIMSVFNGMDLLLQKSTDSFTPDLVISPAKGKSIRFDTTVCRLLEQNPAIASYDEVVEEKAIVKYGDRTAPVIVKGVGEKYATHTRFENNMLEGTFQLKNDKGHQAVVGYGIAAGLGIRLNALTPLTFYYPDKKAGNNLATLHSNRLYPTAFFTSQQDIESQYIFTDIGFARELFHTGDSASKIEIRLKESFPYKESKAALQENIGNRYRINDKYELNKAFYTMMQSEKLAIFMIMLFILLIASFNIIGSVSMLILDKKEDLATYKSMGMNTRKIISVFKTEGRLITLSGSLLGLLVGTGICLAQEKFGLVTLGNGSYIIDAYPVKLVPSDIAIILSAVLLIGYSVSYFPVRYLINKLVQD